MTIVHCHPRRPARLGRMTCILGQTLMLTFSCTWLGLNSDRGATASQSARRRGPRGKQRSPQRRRAAGQLTAGERQHRQAAAQAGGSAVERQAASMAATACPRCDVTACIPTAAAAALTVCVGSELEGHAKGANRGAVGRAGEVVAARGVKGGIVEQHRTGRRGQGWAAHAACTVAGNASTGLGSSSARSHTRQSLQEAIPSQLPAQPHSLVAAYACEAAGGTCAEQHRNHCVPGGAAAAGGGCHARLITGEPPAVSGVQAASEHGPRVRRTAQHAAEPQAGSPAATQTCRPKAVRPVGCSSCVLLKLCWMRFELPCRSHRNTMAMLRPSAHVTGGTVW